MFVLPFGVYKLLAINTKSHSEQRIIAKYFSENGKPGNRSAAEKFLALHITLNFSRSFVEQRGRRGVCRVQVFLCGYSRHRAAIQHIQMACGQRRKLWIPLKNFYAKWGARIPGSPSHRTPECRQELTSKSGKSHFLPLAQIERADEPTKERRQSWKPAGRLLSGGAAEVRRNAVLYGSLTHRYCTHGVVSKYQSRGFTANGRLNSASGFSSFSIWRSR